MDIEAILEMLGDDEPETTGSPAITEHPSTHFPIAEASAKMGFTSGGLRVYLRQGAPYQGSPGQELVNPQDVRDWLSVQGGRRGRIPRKR